MKRKNYSIHIGAPRPTVWNILWGSDSYKAWTSVFSEGSHAETDWKEGSKVLFLDGKGNGMISRIARKQPDAFMSFEHLGVMKDGKEDTATAEWAGATENYTLTDEDGGTRLSVEIDVEGEFESYFDKTFPAALEKVRDLSESALHPAN